MSPSTIALSGGSDGDGDGYNVAGGWTFRGVVLAGDESADPDDFDISGYVLC